MITQALTLAMCPLVRMPFWGCRASSGHHNLFSTGPRGQWNFNYLFFNFCLFVSASYAAIIFTGNRQNSEGNINSYLLFVIYIGLMYKSVQLHAWNHKFPPRKNVCHYMFLGGPVVFFGGAVDFLIHWPPRASGCHSKMSRPDNVMFLLLSIFATLSKENVFHEVGFAMTITFIHTKLKQNGSHLLFCGFLMWMWILCTCNFFIFILVIFTTINVEIIYLKPIKGSTIKKYN